MLYFDARILQPNILNLQKLYLRLMGCAVELLNVNYKLDTLNYQLEILLPCRLRNAADLHT